jgi:hypothetical protein
LITNWMQPAARFVLSRSNEYSRMPMFTVEVGVVQDVPPPPPPVVVGVVLVVVTIFVPALNLPVIPSFPWPVTVQIYVSVPLFVKTTLIDFV